MTAHSSQNACQHGGHFYAKKDAGRPSPTSSLHPTSFITHFVSASIYNIIECRKGRNGEIDVQTRVTTNILTSTRIEMRVEKGAFHSFL